MSTQELKVPIHKTITEERTSSTSDGNHSFQELYDHRSVLFIALSNMITEAYKINMILCATIDDKVYGLYTWKSLYYENGDRIEDDFFLAGITAINFNDKEDDRLDITYHCEPKWWDKFKCNDIQCAPKFTGYTSEDVLNRIIYLFSEGELEARDIQIVSSDSCIINFV